MGVFWLALTIAVIFNVNALYESAQIWSRPSVIADLTTSHFQADRDQASAEATKIFNALDPQFLVGWVKGPTPHDLQSWFIAGASWLIVAGASLFGASFWFDILQRVTHLRGTGLVPQRTELKPALTFPLSAAKPPTGI